MNSFTFIISTFFPEIDIFKTAFEFPSDRNSPINQDFVSYSFLNSLHFGKLKYEDDSKISILNNCILKNYFMDSAKKEYFINVFSKSQKIYHGFCKLAYFFKLKKSKPCNIDTDLFMNSLSSLNPSIIIDLYDSSTKTIYKFRLSDLISIINSSLSHAPEFFSDPQHIKNPYTNIPFSKSQLYNIYFTIKYSTYIMPNLFHLYFLSNFDIKLFGKKNEYAIRDYAVKNFIKNACDDQKIYQIHKMIDSHSRELEGLVIAGGFPKHKLLEAFSRYLKEYLEEAYSLNPAIRYSAKRSLKNKLAKFKKLNPSFGRRILVRNHNNLFNASRNRPTPFIFGNEESPAHVTSRERRYAYVDTYTLESPRITPRQLHNRNRRMLRGTGTNVATSHVITNTTSVLENLPPPPPTLSENEMESTTSVLEDLPPPTPTPGENEMESTTSVLEDLPPPTPTPGENEMESTTLTNSPADESVSVDDATEVDTVSSSSSSPLTTQDIRREIMVLRDALSVNISQGGSTTRFTNQIIDEANEVIRQFDELHNESENDNDIVEPMEIDESPSNSTSDEDDDSGTEDEVED